MADDSNKRFWNRVAGVYTYFQEKGNKDLYATLCARIKPFLRQDQAVLELACGTGQLTHVLASHSASWLATDFSEQMVRRAQKRPNGKQVHYEVQDATVLTYEANQFDLVLIANALHIMPEPDKALQEIKRVLKNDGILIAPTFVYDGKINRFRLLIMEIMGFKTFHRWSSEQYLNYVEDHGFLTIKKELIQGNLLPECLLVCANETCRHASRNRIR